MTAVFRLLLLYPQCEDCPSHLPGQPSWRTGLDAAACPPGTPCSGCSIPGAQCSEQPRSSLSQQVVGVPVGAALPSSVKQAVAIGGGQILVAKASSSVAKAVGPKQVMTQGVAKAIVSGGGGTIVAQPVQTLSKAQVAASGPQKSGPQGSGDCSGSGLSQCSLLDALGSVWRCWLFFMEQFM